MQAANLTRQVVLPDNATALEVFGRYDQYLRLLEEAFGVSVRARGNEVAVTGTAQDCASVAELLEDLARATRQGNPPSEQEVRYAISLAREGKSASFEDLRQDVVAADARGKPIRAKTLGQREYVRLVRSRDIVFAAGPAGTGKTYLAMALAVTALRERRVNRIILTRPAVEAGEKLGFLPGDLLEKVDPYFRPLYDALFEVLGAEAFNKFRERGVVEIAPLGYMRGRTLDDSFVVLDEAQNTTPEQMKMLLTRLGFGSKAIITGDVTQVDLPRGTPSGLAEAQKILSAVRGIGFITLTERDVVRHPLVQEIIRAYERYEAERK